MDLRLTVDFIPKSCFNQNLREVLDLNQWDMTRHDVYERAGHRCEICGGQRDSHPVECYEQWEYDDKEQLQRLVGVIALCPSCHRVKHIGRTLRLWRSGCNDPYWDVTNHFMRENRCNIDDFNAHMENAQRIWVERSKHEWETEIGDYEELLK